MTDSEFACHIKSLMEDQWGTKGPGVKAAEFFRQAAVDGRNLSQVVPDLMRAYLDSNQLPIMIPIADALVIHHLNRKEFGEIKELLEREAFSNYILDSINGLAGRGRDTSDLISTVINSIGATGSRFSQYALSGVLFKYVKRDIGRLSNVVRLMIRNNLATERLPWFLNEYVEGKKADISVVIPDLIKLFKKANPKFKADLANAIMNIAAKAASLDQVVSDLEKLLADKTEKVPLVIAGTLGHHFIKQRDYSSIARFLAHADPEVRWGMVSALNLDLKTECPETVSRLAGAMLDTDSRIRKTASKGLENAMKAGVEVTIPPALLSPAIQALKQMEISDDLLPFLIEYCMSSETRAKAVFALLGKTGSDGDGASIAKLRKACEGKLGGCLLEPCKICRALPRDRVYSMTYDVPKEVDLLNCLHYGGLKQCPSCETYYYYNFHQEHESPTDGMGIITEITVRRISPPEARASLKGEDLDNYRRKMENTIVACCRNLEHVYSFMKENAAWDLFHEYRSCDQTGKIIGLMQHSDPSIRAVVSELVTDKIPEKTPFLSALTAGLEDAEGKVRHNCAKALGTYYFAKKELGKILELLSREDVDVKRMIVWNINRVAKEIDISPFVPALKQLISHSDEIVRKYAKWAMEHIPKAEISGTLEVLLKALENPNPGIRGNALGAIEKLVQADSDVSSTIPAVAGLLLEETDSSGISIRYSAVSLLKAAIAKGVDVSPAFDNLLKVLEKNGESYSGDITFYLILPMNGVDHARAVPVYAKNLLLNKSSKTCALDALERLAKERKTDLTAAEKALESLLEDDVEYDRRRALNALTSHFLNTRQWKKIERFLKHQRKDARWNATAVIRDFAKKGEDVSPLIRLLRKNCSHEYKSLRGVSGEAIAIHYLTTGQLNEVKKLLQDKDKDVRWGMMVALRDLAKRFEDFSELLLLLSENLVHDDEYIRRISLDVLFFAIQKKREHATAILELIGNPGKTKRFADASKLAEKCRGILGLPALPALPAPKPIAKKTKARTEMKQPAAAHSTGFFGPTTQFPLDHIEFFYDDKVVQVGLFRNFDLNLAPFSLLDALHEIEEFNKKRGTKLKLIGHKLADFLLVKSEAWPSLKSYSPFLTDAIIAYEEPGAKLEKEIRFEFEDCPRVVLRTGKHEGKENVALLIKDLRASDFSTFGDVVTIHVPEDRLIPIDPFPDEPGWYIPDPKTMIPNGFHDTVSPEARKLFNRGNHAFIGPVGRGINFGGFHLDDRRYVMVGNFAFIDRFGILVETIS